MSTQTKEILYQLIVHLLLYDESWVWRKVFGQLILVLCILIFTVLGSCFVVKIYILCFTVPVLKHTYCKISNIFLFFLLNKHFFLSTHFWIWFHIRSICEFLVDFYPQRILISFLVPVYILSKFSACKVMFTSCSGDKQIAPLVKEGASSLRVCCLWRFIATALGVIMPRGSTTPHTLTGSVFTKKTRPVQSYTSCISIFYTSKTYNNISDKT